MEIMKLLIEFNSYISDGEEGIEVKTTPTKHAEVVKGLSDSSFVTVVVISNALEIVAHNSEAAIEIVHKYGEDELKKLIAAHLSKGGGEMITLSGNDITPDVLKAMLKYGGKTDDLQD